MARDLLAHAGQRVRIAGWVHHQRKLSKVTFLLVRDASGIAQVVVDGEGAIDQVAAISAESVVEVEGDCVAVGQAPGGVELHSPVVTVIATADAPTPVELRRPILKEQLPMLLDHAPVSLRHPRQHAAFEIAAAAIAGFRSSLDALGFVEIQTPKIVASATESGANVFALGYFDRKAYLAQSPQFFKQAMVGVFERVYETGPVFRAEPHDTGRHLSEYVSLDAELGFIESYTDVMDVARAAVAGMVEAVAARAPSAISLLDATLPSVSESIPSIDFAEAQGLIGKATGEDLAGEPDLAPAHERWLGEWAEAEHGSSFLFVTGYPMVKRPFYTHPDPARPSASNSFDLLFRGLEIATGGQRLHLYADYIAALDARGEDPSTYESYLEAFRYGMPPHGGFAIGLERWVARLIGASNVRETTLFPRDRTRLSP